MKLTKSGLKDLIREELHKLNEAAPKVGSILHFNDGEEWRVTKIVGNPSNPRGVFALPYGKSKGKYVSVALQFSMDDIKDGVKRITEAKLESRFTSDMNTLPKLEKVFKGKKLYNYHTPILLDNGYLTTPRYGTEPRTPTELYKSLKGFISNSKKMDRTVILQRITVDTTSPDKLKELGFTKGDYDKPLKELLPLFQKTPKMIDGVRGFNVRWEDREGDKRRHAGIAASIKQQEKDHPHWSKD
jgi:hypothetical protein